MGFYFFFCVFNTCKGRMFFFISNPTLTHVGTLLGVMIYAFMLMYKHIYFGNTAATYKAPFDYFEVFMLQKKNYWYNKFEFLIKNNSWYQKNDFMIWKIHFLISRNRICDIKKWFSGIKNDFLISRNRILNRRNKIKF